MISRAESASRSGVRTALCLVGLGVLVLLFFRLGPQNILALFHQIGWRFLGVVAIFGAQELVRAAALMQCLPGESRLRFRELLYIRFAGEAVRALTLTGPLLSEPARAWFIKKQGVASSAAAAAVIAEFTAHSFGSAVLMAAGALFLLCCLGTTSGGLRAAAAALLGASALYLVGAAVVLYRRIYLIGSVARAIVRLPGLRRRFRGNLTGVRRTEDALLLVLRDRPGTFGRLMALQLAAHALLILEAYWAILSMGLEVSLVTAFLAESLTKLAHVALFVGAAEGAFALLFHGLGLPAAAGYTLSLIKRLRSLVVALLGLGSLALLQNRRG